MYLRSIEGAEVARKPWAQRLPFFQLIRVEPKGIKNPTYIYDLKGYKKDLWDRLLLGHEFCEGYYRGNRLIFACYNCFRKKTCYWVTNRKAAEKRGVRYHG